MIVIVYDCQSFLHIAQSIMRAVSRFDTLEIWDNSQAQEFMESGKTSKDNRIFVLIDLRPLTDWQVEPAISSREQILGMAEMVARNYPRALQLHILGVNSDHRLSLAAGTAFLNTQGVEKKIIERVRLYYT